jgi:hypothetical protein
LKKVLIISYYFPPSGGPGVQRILKFVKYLPEFGWNPLVLTVEDGDFPARDESLLKEIPENTKVFRTKIFEPYDLYRNLTGKKKNTAIDVENINKEGGKKLTEQIAEFIRATFFIPDARRGWLRYAVREGKRIIDEEKPDLIFSSAPPYTCAMIAMKLKRYHYKKYGKQIPWLSDFRDAWTGYLTSPKRWFIPAAIDASYERKTLDEADAVAMVANGIKDDFDNKYPDISKEKKYFLIRNGFDSEDYKGIPYGIKTNEKFTIVYTGSMYGKRNPFFFIDTITELIKDGKVYINKIRLIFVGRMGGDIENYIKSSLMNEAIEHVPYVPHSESIKYLLEADAMLLLIDEDKYSKMILSGKVFEYLGASLLTGKPVIAITPEGEAADLIRETSAGEIIPHNNREYLSKIFLKYYNSFLSGKDSLLKTNPEAIKQYDRKLLTEKLAKVFNKIIG